MKRISVLFGVLGILVASAAGAQTYPSKPVRIVAPFPPGGVADVQGMLDEVRADRLVLVAPPVGLGHGPGRRRRVGGGTGLLCVQALTLPPRSTSSARRFWSWIAIALRAVCALSF